jgi:hypothetical protein
MKKAIRTFAGKRVPEDITFLYCDTMDESLEIRDLLRDYGIPCIVDPSKKDWVLRIRENAVKEDYQKQLMALLRASANLSNIQEILTKMAFSIEETKCSKEYVTGFYLDEFSYKLTLKLERSDVIG